MSWSVTIIQQAMLSDKVFFSFIRRRKQMAEQKIINFSGYVWEVSSGDSDPGHNHWSSDNVWVDQDGSGLVTKVKD